MPDTVRESVRSYVVRALRHPELADGDDIFEKGGATSLFAAELVLFVEDQLHVALDDDDLVRENFATIDALTRLVETKRGAA